MKLKQLFVLLGGIVLLFLAVWGLFKADLFGKAFSSTSTTQEATALSGIVLLGLALVVLLVAILVIVYWLLELADKNQALALPEGSVRALIAFSLILIFVCIGAFLYNGVNNVELAGGNGKLTKINQAQLDELKKLFVVAYEPARKADGTAEVDTDGKSPLFNATYYSKRSKEADDFAKQIFTTLATVFVSVISFYFGSSSATSAMKTSGSGGGSGPKISPP
jgi:hypothetical protein